MLNKKILLVLGLFILNFTLTGCDSEATYNTAMKIEESHAGLQEKNITLDYGNISYLENNIISDTTLLLIHGYTSNKDIWNKFVTALGHRYHVVVPDLAGHGKSVASMEFDYSLTGHTSMLEKFIQAKGLTNFVLIGNSMGGGISAMYASKYPNKVKALVLIDSFGFIETSPVEEHEISPNNPLYNVCTLSEYDRYVSAAMVNPPYIPHSVKKYLMQQKCARHTLEEKMYIALYNCLGIEQVEQEISAATLIIWGKKDRIIHVDNAQIHHENIAQSKVVIFNHIGHMPMFEAPFKTAYHVRKFLNHL